MRLVAKTLDDEDKRILHNFSFEFEIHHRKQNGVECAPVTMHGYVHDVRRALSYVGMHFAINADDILNESKSALLNVMTNRFAEQQSRGVIGKPHNTLSNSDVLAISRSEFCNPCTPKGLRNRLVFALGICIGAQHVHVAIEIKAI